MRVAANIHTLSIGARGREVGIEVICHNDLSACNFVFRQQTPIAIKGREREAAFVNGAWHDEVMMGGPRP